tara:strand:+ start:1052 stop:1969 length:918 start_codon:yes stop_codon:yes gene_type:complete
MTVIKVPEFKKNEKISADDFNNAFNNFTSLNLDGDNFADESLGFDQIPNNISLTDSSKLTKSIQRFDSEQINFRNDGIYNPFNPAAGDSYTGQRLRRFNHPGRNHITISGLSAGDKFIIRASCQIYVPDVGWRTFYSGVPPIFKVGLVRFPGEVSADFTEGSSNSNTQILSSTWSQFRIAFTGKVPSASSLSAEAAADAFLFLDTSVDPEFDYRDNREGEEYDRSTNFEGMFFAGQHSYTCSYVHEQDSTDVSTQSFGLMCHFDGAKAGSPPDTVVGGRAGCALPNRLIPAQVRNFEIFVYQVKK